MQIIIDEVLILLLALQIIWLGCSVGPWHLFQVCWSCTFISLSFTSEILSTSERKKMKKCTETLDFSDFHFSSILYCLKSSKSMHLVSL